MKIRLRKQKHAFSCGIACVAMVANKSYDTVLQDYSKANVVEWKCINERWIIDYGTYTKDIVSLFRKYSIRSRPWLKPYTGKDCLPELSLLEVNVHKAKIGTKIENCWHWVVAHREGNKVVVYDPARGIIDLRKCKPIHRYLEIYL